MRFQSCLLKANNFSGHVDRLWENIVFLQDGERNRAVVVS